MIGVFATLFVDLFDAQLPKDLQFCAASGRDGIGDRDHAAEMRLLSLGDVVLNDDTAADHLDIDGHAFAFGR